MKIVVLDGNTLNPGDNPWDAVQSLGELTVHPRTDDLEQVVARAEAAQVLVTNKAVIDRAVIEQLPDLKFIAVTATGYNVVDIEAARERGISVSNVPLYSTESVAQFVFAMLLSRIHQPANHDAAIRDGKWQASGNFCFWLSNLEELSGKTLGIIGMGRIGRATGRLASAFGMKVIGHSRTERDTPDWPGYEWVSLGQVCERSDFLTLHCPQTESNAEFVNTGLISKMKPTAVLVNTARGGLINESDLAQALNDGVIGGACLDVLSSEPPATDNPLLTAKNCLLTPHIAWATLEARQRLMQTTADNIAAFQAGQPINVCN